MSTNKAYIDDTGQDALSEIEISIKEMDNTALVIPSDNDDTTNRNRLKDYIIILILFVINLLNYIDRYTIAGVLKNIQKYYGIDNTKAGLLQTSFIVTYMIMSPVFGFLGDRFSRKALIIGGVTFWSIITLSSSFVPSNLFPLFLVMRSMVGIGEASYCTVAPTIISDIYVGDMRTKVMAFFYFAIPVGSGLGYILAQSIESATHDWRNALRFSPVIGFIGVFLLFFFVKEPTRGSAEGGTHLASSPWSEDIRQLTKNRSFMLISFGVTCVCFGTGSLAWWIVSYLDLSVNALKNDPKASDKSNNAIVFGAMTIVAGIIGVVVGTESGRRLRKRWLSSDPIVCAFGLILAAPFMFVAVILSKSHLNWSLINIFLAETLLCLNWALVTDMTMGVVIPTRRATASAYQMIISHAFGDAGSPYIIGAISDKLNSTYIMTNNATESGYMAMKYSLMVNPFVSVLGGIMFLWCSFYIVMDKARVHKIIEDSQFQYGTLGSSYKSEYSQLLSDPVGA